jgi:phosphatidylglycerophosphate synthase
MEASTLNEKMEKLPEGCRFFDVNQLWYFPNRLAVRLLYPLPVSANQITGLALVMGLISAGFYFWGGEPGMIWGAVFLYGKLFFDNVDGNLARVRGEVSRLGRFLDSFSDFVVTALVYAAVAMRLADSTPHSGFIWAMGTLALLSALMQCSYWVYYYVQYTHRVGSYEKNRADESVTEEDRVALESGEMTALEFFLQRFHNIAYGWQDRGIEILDRISRRLADVGSDESRRQRWFGDQKFLVYMGPLCVCTNTMAFVVFSLMGRMEWFFYAVVIGMNGYWLGLHVWKVIRFRQGKG